MAKRQRVWAAKARARLLAALGGKCSVCGTDENLEFDCIQPCGDAHHRMESSGRMSFYHGQHQQGNIQILCHDCNAQKGSQDALEMMSEVLKTPLLRAVNTVNNSATRFPGPGKGGLDR